MGGAVCVLGLPDAVSGVNVAEGLADVLAPASRLPWPAICTGGSGGYRNADLARWLAGLGAVHVWADLDEPDGIKAAGVLAGRVVVLGGVSWIERVGVGADRGEAGAPFPRPWTLRPSSPTPATWSATACRRGKRAAWRR